MATQHKTRKTKTKGRQKSQNINKAQSVFKNPQKEAPSGVNVLQSGKDTILNKHFKTQQQ